jgi:serine/threonine-protein kinase
MAPEQTVGGGLIDARTDIYAVGVVLFEMICGDRPFQAEDTLALLGMHRAAPIPQLIDRVPDDAVLPQGLQEVVEKAMAKSPGDRFQSAIELAEAIDGVTSAPLVRDSHASPVVRGSAATKRAAGVAPTMLDLSDAAELVAPVARGRAKPRGSFLGSLLVLAVLLGGVTAAVWWIRARSSESKSALRGGNKPPDQPVAIPSADSKRDGTSAPKSDIRDLKPDASAKANGSGAVAATGSGSAVASDLGTPPTGSGAEAPASSGSDSAAPASAAGSAAPTAGSAEAAATGSGEGSGTNSAAEAPPVAGQGQGQGSTDPGHTSAPRPAAKQDSEIEMDPATAEDPAPPSAKPSKNDDEAANAPKTAEEVAKRAPPAPARATTLPGAVQLIAEGKRDLALAALHALAKKNTNSAYIPFLLGNLYYDQRWWSVAIDHYAVAIKKNAKYRSNPTLNRNVISMLASHKTAQRAEGFLKFNVGKPAFPFVKYAAQHDSNAQVKRLSGWLLKNL